MTQNKRIILNTVATYGRSMFGVLCGIFSARWVLAALGQVDFGLYGLIGGLIIFVSFLNIQLASAITRYYAFSIGQAKASCDKQDALGECQAWFSTAVFTHTIFPMVLMALGWPIGEYAISHGWIVIPDVRVCACVWLWRFVCLTSFVGMLNVPFQAMYTAKQYIAELTIYSFVQTIFRTAFIYYMFIHPGYWLVKYGIMMCVISVVPQVVIAIRAIFVFPECRLRIDSLCVPWRLAQLGRYAFWQMFGGLGYIACHQGMGVLINQFFGPALVGSFSVSQTVAGEAASLTGALQGAFSPAIISACGAGNLERMRSLSFKACRYGTLLTLLFALPMALEIDELLEIWLKEPPPFAAGVCLCALAFIVIEKLSIGHLTAVNASGNVARFQMSRGVLRMSVIPIALILGFCDCSVASVTCALPISVTLVVLCDVVLARRIVGMSVRYWISNVVLPLIIVFGIAACVGTAIRLLMVQSLARLLVSSALTIVIALFLSWGFLFTVDEKEFIKSRLNRMWKRVN